MHFSEKYFEDNGVEDFVVGEIESIWQRASTVISQKWLATIDIPLCTDIAVMKMKKIVALATFEHDGIVEPDHILEKLNPDEEPTSISIDPWARGTGYTQVKLLNLIVISASYDSKIS